MGKVYEFPHKRYTRLTSALDELAGDLDLLDMRKIFGTVSEEEAEHILASVENLRASVYKLNQRVKVIHAVSSTRYRK